MSTVAPPEIVRKHWATLRKEFVFLPPLDRMTVQTQQHPAEAIEFLRVVPRDEVQTLPSAEHVPETDVEQLAGWSSAEADQQAMWSLVGSSTAGSRVTETCSSCAGQTQVVCTNCHGSSYTRCTWCFGSGRTSCSSCGGSGGTHVTNTTTNSDGTTSTTTEWRSCMSCGGMGSNSCTWCMGRGRVDCNLCRGGYVDCQPCAATGQVDRFIQRSFESSAVQTHVMPMTIPDYPGYVQLTRGQVQLARHPSQAPYDAVTDQQLLTARNTAPAARLFFLREGTVTVHRVTDPATGLLCMSLIEGAPAPLVTVHRLVADARWSPERERSTARGAVLLYLLSAVSLGLGLALDQSAVGAGVSLVLAVGAVLLYRSPVRAYRAGFMARGCTSHGQLSVRWCPHCSQALCHQCLCESVRCGSCGAVTVTNATHIIQYGQWTAIE